MKLLTTGNTKTLKGEKLGYKTHGIHFSPANKSGYEVCQWRSKGCTFACLDTAGRGQMQFTQDSRTRKTKFFFEDREVFMAQLIREIGNAVKLAEKHDMTPCFRLNLTSDIEWEKVEDENGKTIFDHYPQVQLYDYTKSFGRMARFLNGDFPSNYHLTFSRSENNQKLVEMVLAMGGNVAVVFRDQLPATWESVEVVNGDANDLRFLDKSGVIVGLIEKGLAKKDETGFVQEGVNS